MIHNQPPVNNWQSEGRVGLYGIIANCFESVRESTNVVAFPLVCDNNTNFSVRPEKTLHVNFIINNFICSAKQLVLLLKKNKWYRGWHQCCWAGTCFGSPAGVYDFVFKNWNGLCIGSRLYEIWNWVPGSVHVWNLNRNWNTCLSGKKKTLIIVELSLTDN
jgi:hypothetical protein